MHGVLLVDDDREVLRIHGEYLKKKGYKVFLAESAYSAIQLVQSNSVSCIVMDVMMPELNGFEALKEIRKYSAAPILFLTGRFEEADRIRGLSIGADDYIIKPCSLEELSLRIMIRIRSQQQAKSKEGVLEFQLLRIDLLQQKVFYNEKELSLTKREYQLLVLFVKNPNKLLTFDEIGRQLWGEYQEEDRKNIMVSTSRLRKKLEGYVGFENRIETTWGEGYRFRE